MNYHYNMALRLIDINFMQTGIPRITQRTLYAVTVHFNSGRYRTYTTDSTLNQTMCVDLSCGYIGREDGTYHEIINMTDYDKISKYVKDIKAEISINDRDDDDNIIELTETKEKFTTVQQSGKGPELPITQIATMRLRVGEKGYTISGHKITTLILTIACKWTGNLKYVELRTVTVSNGDKATKLANECDVRTSELLDESLLDKSSLTVNDLKDANGGKLCIYMFPLRDESIVLVHEVTYRDHYAITSTAIGLATIITYKAPALMKIITSEHK
jgi:hypothetical protein